MHEPSLTIASLQNPRIKATVKLRQRSHRDEAGLMLIEGYRELKRALDNRHFPQTVFFCEELFQGGNEPDLLQRAAAGGAELLGCTVPVFEKIAFRDRPEGLLAVAPQVRHRLEDFNPGKNSLLVVAESIEKPGNLGTILRSADAAGVHAVLICDRCTDINNPNVVRASIGTLFSLPVIETDTETALNWLRTHGIHIVAATPHTDLLYTRADMTHSVALVVGTEQYGLSTPWIDQAEIKVRIPMLGQADSLNVASATTLLLYEAVRQRMDQHQSQQGKTP